MFINYFVLSLYFVHLAYGQWIAKEVVIFSHNQPTFYFKNIDDKLQLQQGGNPTVLIMQFYPYRPTTTTSTTAGPTAACGGNINNESGIIVSPNWPSNYNNTLNCVWYFTVSNGNRIVFEIEEAEFENTICNYDYLMFSDGLLDSSNILGKFCTEGNQIKSTGKSMKVLMYTDGSGTAKGFKARWYVEPAVNILYFDLLTKDGLYLTYEAGVLVFKPYDDNDDAITFLLFPDIHFPGSDVFLYPNITSNRVYHQDSYLKVAHPTEITDLPSFSSFIIKPLETHTLTTNPTNELKIGSVLTATIAFNIERENNKNIIYMMVNKSSGFEEKAQFFINKLNKKEEMTVKYDPFTKKNYRIEDETSNRAQYDLEYRVVDEGIQADDNVILTMINSNDDNIIISAQSFTLSKDISSNCRLADNAFKQSIIDNQLVIYFSTFLNSSGCGKDLTNVVFNLYNVADELLPQRIEIGPSSISPTLTNIENNVVEIIFGRVGLGTYIQITVIYEANQNADYSIFKPTTILHEMIYNSYVGDVKEEVIETKKFETFISNTGKGGYTILRNESSLCLDGISDDKTNKENHMFVRYNCYTKFRLTHHNILTEERKMIDGENNKLEIKMADYKNNIKNVEWEEDNIKTFTASEYLSSLTFVNGSNVFTETSKTNAFKREPTSSFGLVTNINETKEISNYTTTISVVELENEILFCSYESTDGISECYFLEPVSLEVRGFSWMFRNLGGCNITSCYGIDLYGNHLLYSDGKHYIIKESYYDTLVASGVYVAAVDTKLLDTVNNGPEQISAKLSVAYYDLISTDNSQVVLWKTENDCESKVAHSAHVAAHSCEAIKKHCKTAKSGKYWLALSGTSYHVYCDMDTDRGGWLMVANIERTGGVVLGASDSYDLNELLENPESYFPDYWGMEYIHDIMPYTQIRLYCFTDNPVRTSHIRTTDTQFGYNALSHIFDPSLPTPAVCLSYRFYANDNSESLSNCSSWDWGTSTYKYNEFPSRNQVNGISMWSIENGLCDQSSAVYQNAVWKIFLR